MIRNILSLPEPILRRKAHKVVKIDPDLQKLIADMIETMRVAPGVGLAAPQIGIPKRVIVVEYGDDEDDEVPKKLYTLVNPEIISTSEEKISGIEGCLSVPELVGEVDRNTKVIVRGWNRQGKMIKIKAEGWLARIFQHELDHLDGVLYPDRASKVWKPEKFKPELDV
jgi:peptide deformylase